MTKLAPAGQPRICIGLATKDRANMVHSFLWSLIRQTYKAWDVIVVDDSTPALQWLRTGPYPLLLREIERMGNKLIGVEGPKVSAATGFQGALYGPFAHPYFFRADDDAYMEPDYLERLVRLITSDPNMGAVGGLYLHPGSEIPVLEPDSELYKHALIDHLSDHMNIKWCRHERTDPIPVEHLTAMMLFHAEKLKRLAGFETELYLSHRDETQASWRMHVEGHKLYVDPQAVAWHLRSAQGGVRNANRQLDDHRNFMAQKKSMKPGIHVNLQHAIGDIIMAVPAIEALAKANPGRELVISTNVPEVFDNNPYVAHAVKHPFKEQRTARLHGSIYNSAGSSRFSGHLMQAYFDIFGAPSNGEKPLPQLYCTAENPIEGRPYVVIAPWSLGKTLDFAGPSHNKDWPLNEWVDLVKWIKEEYPDHTVYQTRKDPEEEPLVEGAEDICDQPLSHVFAVIRDASLVVSVDTMAHHVATASGVSNVVLWGRSDPANFGYYEPYVRNVKGFCPGRPVHQITVGEDGKQKTELKVQARPCIQDSQWNMDLEPCPLKDHPCMSTITQEAVRKAIKSLMKPQEITHGAERAEIPRGSVGHAATL